MSFSMSDIKVTKPEKNQDIKDCYRLIFSNDLLTNIVKKGLWQYCSYRFSKRNRGRLTEHLLQDMIEELLEKVCEKPYKSIGINDVEIKEKSIINQIQRAIYFGATRNLYYDIPTNINIDVLNNIKPNIQKSRKDITLEEKTIQYLEDLFK